MQKDLKIGMALGLEVVAAAVVWLCTRPSLSTRARMLHTRKSGPVDEPVEPVRFVTKLPNTSSTGTTTTVETDQSNAADFTVRKQAEKTRGQRFHTVSEGETLSDISCRYYGSASKWKKIRDVNRIKDANRIRPGTRLIIPD